jgi:DMSO reductase family type II enzyme chaperone
MSEITRADAVGSSATPAVIRSRIYQLFALAIQYPDGEWVEAIRQGELGDALIPLLAMVDESLVADVDRGALSDAGEGDDALAVEYTRLFDVGPGGSAISLFGGHHQGGRTQTMEEVLRFYLHFGLERNETQHELPDHLISELEFLHFLTFQQARIEDQGGDSSHHLRGQRDFLERQLGRWSPRLSPLLAEHRASSHYVELFRLLDLFLLHDRERTIPSLV